MVPSTGMPLVLFAVSVTAGMLLRSVAVVLPWLKITIPTAPLAAATSALISNVHVPRWSNAMFPAGKPVQSACLATAGQGVAEAEHQVDGRNVRGDVPGSVWVIAPKSMPSTYVIIGSGATFWSCEGPTPSYAR